MKRPVIMVDTDEITEETQMKENVCVDCKYYERCGKPERYMKCMGYEERQQAAEETGVHD